MPPDSVEINVANAEVKNNSPFPAFDGLSPLISLVKTLKSDPNLDLNNIHLNPAFIKQTLSTISSPNCAGYILRELIRMNNGLQYGQNLTDEVLERFAMEILQTKYVRLSPESLAETNKVYRKRALTHSDSPDPELANLSSNEAPVVPNIRTTNGRQVYYPETFDSTDAFMNHTILIVANQLYDPSFGFEDRVALVQGVTYSNNKGYTYRIEEVKRLDNGKIDSFKAVMITPRGGQLYQVYNSSDSDSKSENKIISKSFNLQDLLKFQVDHLRNRDRINVIKGRLTTNADGKPVEPNLIVDFKNQVLTSNVLPSISFEDLKNYKCEAEVKDGESEATSENDETTELRGYFGNDMVSKLKEFIAADEYLADKEFYTNNP